MSEEHVEIVRRLFEANRSGSPAERDHALRLVHPELEFKSRVASIEGAIYRGKDGVARYFDDFADAFREWENEIVTLEQIRPGTVLVEATFRGVSHSGVSVELPSAVVCVVSDQQVRRIDAYENRSEALEAVGLSK